MQRRSHAAWTPRYGTVRGVTLYGLLAIVVNHGWAAFRATVVALLGVGPGVAAQVLFGLLAVFGLALVGVELRRQARAEPEFTLKAARQKYLESRVPTRPLFGLYVALLLAGGYVALFARGVFFTRLDNALLVVRRLAESGTPGAFSVDALAFGAAFVVGAVAFAHATDRVLVAGVRKVIARGG